MGKWKRVASMLTFPFSLALSLCTGDHWLIIVNYAACQTLAVLLYGQCSDQTVGTTVMRTELRLLK